jgi:hypothetical protein
MRSQPGGRTHHRESIAMKRHVDPGSLKKLLLPLAGAALMLVGCSNDPVGTAPGGLEPSASSQQSDERQGPARSDSGSQSGGAGNSGSDSSGADTGSGDGSGSAN